MNLKNKIDKLIRKITDKVTGNGLMQETNNAEGMRYVTEGMPELARQAGAEGIVLLKNDGLLPFENGVRISVFGRCQFDWFYVGYGSGGDVKAPYYVNPDSAFTEAEKEGKLKINKELRDMYMKWRSIPDNEPSDGWWGHWPMNYPEMRITADIAFEAKKNSDVALVIIGRAAGEDRENVLEKGSYYLTDTEEEMLKNVTDAFDNVAVVIDAGNIIDMEWTMRYADKIKSIVYAWQGGMESGHSLVDVLTGRVNPSGKLTDTIACRYEDYPSMENFGNKEFNNYVEDIYVGYRYFETFAKDKALYPFGYGLSYTTFDIKVTSFNVKDGKITTDVKVTNKGNRSGKEVVQLYVAAPCGKLGKAARVLQDFAKTDELQPGESVVLNLSADEYGLASYDDSGVTGNKHAYVLEEGEYVFYIGNSVRTDNVAGAFTLKECKVIKRLNGVCGVIEPFKRMKAVISDGRFAIDYEEVPKADYSLKERIEKHLPAARGCKPYNGAKLKDVADGKITLDEFVAMLTDSELEALTRGYGAMNVPFGVRGNAGAYGGIVDSLKDKGIRPLITTDGPAGIRIGHHTSLLPSGTNLASTWDTALVERLYEKVGEEMLHYKVDILLGAGMNIHRNPLCGRNFEYYSEDPLISGRFASAFVDGVQSKGLGACPKHFACNNQETRRNRNDSRVSERALREIYLKGFEICINKSNPLNVMTSYNKINGVWSHYNYDLVTTVLREEWGYDGTVITDWWMRKSVSPEFPKLKNNAYRVRAQVDVLMPGDMKYVAKGYKQDKELMRILKKNPSLRGDLERSAKNTLKSVLKLMNVNV